MNQIKSITKYYFNISKLYSINIHNTSFYNINIHSV